MLGDRPQVVGGVEPGGLRDLGPQVRNLHDPASSGDDGGAQVAHAQHGQEARVERSGRQDHLVGRRDRRDGLGRRGGVARHELDPTDPPGAVLHRDLALDGFALDVGLQHDRVRRRREHPADRVEQTAGFVERGGEVAHRLGQPDDDEVAECVAPELAAAEAMLERLAPHRVAPGQRDQAAAQIAGRGDAEVAPQPA